MRPLKVAVATSTRADFGLLYWILKSIEQDDELELLLYVTGSHLSMDFGATADEITAAGMPIARRIEILLASDTPLASAKTMSLALSGFADAFEQDRPDALVLLGDRFEIVPMALASVLMSIPVAHIHGGETSEGAQDEYFRHAVTKLSTLHFAATELYRQRIIQMGELPQRTFNFGAPGLDHLARTALMSREELTESIGFGLDSPIALATFHPVTTAPTEVLAHIEALLDALSAEVRLRVVFTKANADAGGRLINSRLEVLCRQHPARFRLFDSLGSRRYLSCLKHFDLLVGNSSSGLTEAPSFALPVVNVGDRQKGRVAAMNVIHVGYGREEIRQGLHMALSTSFIQSLKGMRNPYAGQGDGNNSARIVTALKSFLSRRGASGKQFIDFNVVAKDGL